MAFALVAVGMLGACGSGGKTGSSSAPDTAEVATVTQAAESTVAETDPPTTEAATTTEAPDTTAATTTEAPDTTAAVATDTADAMDTQSLTEPIDYRHAAEQAINDSSELEHGACEMPQSIAAGTTFTCTADIADDGTARPCN